jgi:hypothetical protein
MKPQAGASPLGNEQLRASTLNLYTQHRLTAGTHEFYDLITCEGSVGPMRRRGDTAQLGAEQVNVKRALRGMDGLEGVFSLNLQ